MAIALLVRHSPILQAGLGEPEQRGWMSSKKLEKAREEALWAQATPQKPWTFGEYGEGTLTVVSLASRGLRYLLYDPHPQAGGEYFGAPQSREDFLENGGRHGMPEKIQEEIRRFIVNELADGKAGP